MLVAVGYKYSTVAPAELSISSIVTILPSLISFSNNDKASPVLQEFSCATRAILYFCTVVLGVFRSDL